MSSTATWRRLAAPVGVLLLLAALLSALTSGAAPLLPVPAARADGPGVGTPYVVSVGDSYISGEAGRWAGSSNVSSSYADALGSTAATFASALSARSIQSRVRRGVAAL